MPLLQTQQEKERYWQAQVKGFLQSFKTGTEAEQFDASLKPSLISKLLPLLNDSDAQARSIAAEALKKLGYQP